MPLRGHLAGHTVQTAFELGWSHLENGALLAAAEDSFDLLITLTNNFAISKISSEEN